MNIFPFKFTSGPGKGANFALLIFSALFLTVLPTIVTLVCFSLGMDDINDINFTFYALSAIIAGGICFKVLRQDFDSFVSHPFFCVMTVLGSFLLARFVDTFMGLFVSMLMGGEVENLNNNEVMADFGTAATGAITATTLFLAPIAEELVFRVGIFGTARKVFKKAWPAYLAGVGIFSLFHVISFAFSDPSYLIMGLLYVPLSFALCFCYERTNSVWSSILLHFINNGIALGVLSSGII